jgi:hypothetical protein
MIIQGSKGSINVFVNDLFISSFPLNKKYNLDVYKKESDNALIEGLKEGIKLKTMIKVFFEVIESYYQVKKNNKRMSSEDHQLLFVAILSLIKLNKIDPDDYLLICGRKKPKKLKVY